MFKLIRSIFGISSPQRTASEEPKSKTKMTEMSPLKRIPSLDSKNKVLETNKRNAQPLQPFFELDEVNTVKKTLRGSMKEAFKIEAINEDFVSDLNSGASDCDSDQDLLQGLPENQQTSERVFRPGVKDIYEKDEIFTFCPDKESHKKINGQFQFQGTNQWSAPNALENKKELKLKKILVHHENPKRQPIKWRIQCPFCSKPIEKETSERLACSHRFHESCALKMRLRNRFQCDLCEIKKRNQGSIILIDRKKNRSYSRSNVP